MGSISATGTNGVAMSPVYTWSWTTNGAPLSVTATTPSANATAVPVANSIVATFSEAIQSGSLDFTIAPTSGDSNVSGRVSLDDITTIATFFPQKPFSYRTGYTASISATGTDGTAMPSPYTWSWTAIEMPPSGSLGIPAFTFTFTTAIVSTGLTITATVNGSDFPGVTTYNSTSHAATFTPMTPFVAGTKYLLTISGVMSADGTPMATRENSLHSFGCDDRQDLVRWPWKTDSEGWPMSRERDVRNAIQDCSGGHGSLLRRVDHRTARALRAGSQRPHGRGHRADWDQLHHRLGCLLARRTGLHRDLYRHGAGAAPRRTTPRRTGRAAPGLLGQRGQWAIACGIHACRRRRS